MLYTHLFGGSFVSERIILISIDWWVIPVVCKYLASKLSCEMLNALDMTQQHNGYTEIIDISKPSRGQFNPVVLIKLELYIIALIFLVKWM